MLDQPARVTPLSDRPRPTPGRSSIGCTATSAPPTTGALLFAGRPGQGQRAPALVAFALAPTFPAPTPAYAFLLAGLAETEGDLRAAASP